MADQFIVNNVEFTLDSDFDEGETVMTSAALANWLEGSLGINFTEKYVLVTITQPVPPETSWEVVKVIWISGNDLTVERGQDGTSDEDDWTAGALLSCRTTAGTILRARRQVERILTSPTGTILLGVSGEILLGAEID